MTSNKCIYRPCQEVVTDEMPHVTLRDGSVIHLDCVINFQLRGSPRSAIVLAFQGIRKQEVK
jgi:hypothetical protein